MQGHRQGIYKSSNFFRTKDPRLIVSTGLD